MSFNEEQLKNAFFSIVWIEEGNLISFKAEHWEKSDEVIEVNDEGYSKITFFIDLQFWKIVFPRFVTDEGIVISSNETHWSNARSSIVFKEEDNDTFFNDVHPLNACLPIVSIFEGIAISVNLSIYLKASFRILAPGWVNKRLRMSTLFLSAAASIAVTLFKI